MNIIYSLYVTYKGTVIYINSLRLSTADNSNSFTKYRRMEY